MWHAAVNHRWWWEMPRFQVFKMNNFLLVVASYFRRFSCKCVCVLERLHFRVVSVDLWLRMVREETIVPRYACGLAINILLFTLFLQFQVFHCMYRVLTEAHTKEQCVIVSLPI